MRAAVLVVLAALLLAGCAHAPPPVVPVPPALPVQQPNVTAPSWINDTPPVPVAAPIVTREAMAQADTSSNASAAMVASEFAGSDAVEAWAWNDAGSVHLLMPEGASVDALGHVIEARLIGEPGLVQFALDGKTLPLAHADEEIDTAAVHIYVQHVYLNVVQK